MSRCCFCKQPIPGTVGGFYVSFRPHPGKVLFKQWCRKCDAERPGEVEALLTAVERRNEWD